MPKQLTLLYCQTANFALRAEEIPCALFVPKPAASISCMHFHAILTSYPGIVKIRRNGAEIEVPQLLHQTPDFHPNII